ncbi:MULTISPECIES: ATP-binding protein [unclassified Haematospirillum]|uniref:ATP-binding protein n=1 Tax=unclassified Haematospirillum TaxID=2622088 RepID=UPI00143CB16D|nr:MULTISPECIES: ATP-binding protein [unclassified Haematospirillum]NKD55077.1 response regulator [Haematospirillum sp. H4890]NKD75330.1 response regulator [Haematospirillum sp. H4485]NKD87604.1 response regulator [Haematospirillum sp. 15-248]
MQLKTRDRLTLRQLRYTLAIALLLGLVLSAIQVARDYAQHNHNTNLSALRALDAFHYAGVQAAYTLDTDLANDVVRGLVADGPIVSARIISDLGDRLAAIEVAPDEESALYELLFDKPNVVRRDLTKVQPGGRIESIGVLEAEISPRRTAGPFLERAVLNLISVLVQTVALAALLSLVYLHTTTRPLTQIVARLHEPEENAAFLRELPIPRGHENDEIGFLVLSFNRLLRSAEAELQARRLAEENLRKSNDALELRVEERTSHLNQEIMERRSVEEALRQSEERFKDLTEVSSDWFWETGLDGRISLVSDRFFSVSGLARERIVGRRLSELVGNGTISDVSQGADSIEEMMEQRAPLIRYDMSMQGIEERLYFRINAKPVYDFNGDFTGYRGTGRDITQSRLFETRLDEARTEAERANAAKSHFLASMSHELRTPLNAILGFAQLLRAASANALTTAQKKYVQHILDAGDHLLRLINEILDLARIEAGKVDLSVENVDVRLLVTESTALLEPLAAKRQITIHAEGSTDPVFVMADRSRLKQVIINLGSNAIKYNREAGHVYFKIGPAPEAGHVRVTVQDTGIGIAPEMLKKVFEPFNRLGAEATNIEGTGIGLTVTSQILAHMNGKIGVESTQGVGSSFWFDLPAGDNTVKAKKEEIVEELPAGSGEKPLKVLYVEDNPANRDLMRDVMDLRENVTLVMAEDGATGISMALSEKPDLILLDIHLPDMTGIEIAQRLRGGVLDRPVPIIAVSAGAMKKDIERARDAGIDDYICKPFNISQMLTLLDQVADGSYKSGTLSSDKT